MAARRRREPRAGRRRGCGAGRGAAGARVRTRAGPRRPSPPPRESAPGERLRLGCPAGWAQEGARTTPRAPRAWFPGPRGGRREGGMSRRGGPGVTPLRKICRSGPQPRLESSGPAALSHGLHPRPWELGGDPPHPDTEVLARILRPQGGQRSHPPQPSPRQPTPTKKAALAFIRSVGTLCFSRGPPPWHGGRGGDGERGNPGEHPGGGVVPHLLPSSPSFSWGAPPGSSTHVWGRQERVGGGAGVRGPWWVGVGL